MKQTGLENAAGLLSWATLACILTLLNVFLGRFVPIPPFGTFAGHLMALLYLAALLLALLHTARAASRLPVSTAFLLIAGTILSLPTLLQILTNVFKLPVTLDILAVFLPFPVQIVVSNLLAPIGMTLLGAGIGRIIKHPNTLLAGAGVAIFFDIVVVTMGTVAQLLKHDAQLIAAVSVGAGGGAPRQAPGAPPVTLPPPVSSVTIGPADVLFLALFLSAVWHLRLSNRATFAWMYLLLFAALLLVETTGLPIPALAPMGAAVLIANLRHAAFTEREKKDLKIGAAFAVFCAVLMVIGARLTIKPSPKPVGGQPIGFRIGRASQTGVFAILEVVPGSRAEAGGLRPGDAVLKLNGRPIADIGREEYARMLQQAGTRGVTLTIKSGDQPAPRDIVFPASSSPLPSPSAPAPPR
jgi:hypothetical protein